MLRPGKGNSALPTNYGNGGQHSGSGGNYNNGSGYGGYNSGGQNYGSYQPSYGGDAYSSVSLSSKGGSPRSSRRHGESPVVKFLKMPMVWLALGCFVLVGTTAYYRGKYNQILKQMDVKAGAEVLAKYQSVERERTRIQRQLDNASIMSKGTEDRMNKVKQETLELKQRHEELQQATSLHGRELQERSAKRDAAWEKQVYLLQNATVRESRRAVIDKFGEGAHHVKFTLQFPEEEETTSFVAEMAPLSLMPHAVHLFLEQVFNRLWDGTYIYLNGPHVLQVGPQEYDEDREEGYSMKPFLDSQLDKLAFPEYSTEFPHLPMTMGFTGRPGGPDWYINKGDNSKAHGPGGQRQHPLDFQADPCFAKIVAGEDVVMRISDLKFYPPGDDYQYYIEEPVTIVTARIVERLPPQEKLGNETDSAQEDALAQAKEAMKQKMKKKKPRRVQKDHQVEP